MKAHDAALAAYLQQCIDRGMTEIPYCELFTITLSTGDVLTYTDFDADVVIGGTRFLGSGLIIPSRGNTKSKVGTEVDEMELDFLCGDDDNGNPAIVLRGMTMHMLAAAGWLNQASVLVQRLFWEQTGVLPPWGPIIKFSGRISKPSQIGQLVISLDVLAWTQLLQRQVPNTIMSPGCLYALFDARCGVPMANYGVACTMAAGSSAVLLTAAQLTQAPGWFDNGFVVFTSGANKGLAASINSYALGTGLQLDAPLIVPLAVGDQFTAYPGCDGQATTCATNFNNAGRYPAWPYVPAPEMAF